MADPVRVAVLVSGRGSNMLALSEHKRRDPERSYMIALVASNVPEARGLVLAKRLGARARGLAADVQQVCAVGRHLHAGLDRPLRIHQQSAVGERIGCHIEDAHDERALAERERPAVRQRERKAAAGIHEETLSNAGR